MSDRMLSQEERVERAIQLLTESKPDTNRIVERKPDSSRAVRVRLDASRDYKKGEGHFGTTIGNRVLQQILDLDPKCDLYLGRWNGGENFIEFYFKTPNKSDD